MELLIAQLNWKTRNHAGRAAAAGQGQSEVVRTQSHRVHSPSSAADAATFQALNKGHPREDKQTPPLEKHRNSCG